MKIFFKNVEKLNFQLVVFIPSFSESLEPNPWGVIVRVPSSAEISRIECVISSCTSLTAFGTDVAVESFESNASATGLTNSLSERFVKFSAFFC